MKTLKEYFLNKDEQIKRLVQSMAGYKNLNVEFLGYYIDNNNLTGTFTSRPLYKSYKDYKSQNPYEEINHIRYFFELNNDNKKHSLTVTLNNAGVFDVGFSIDALAQGFEDNSPELDFKESDFSQLMAIIKLKFD
ncbi:hypothetical protein GSB9_02043 [Flavobacteriaceae bacterium GSB9]|nr:hypothetical protein GSB9_02043 [Flavobacteriaceae bacterium GSB9]